MSNVSPSRESPSQPTLYHDPVTMLYNLLLGITITADDGVTLISPTLDVPSSGYTNTHPGTDAATIYVKKHPYTQEIDKDGRVVWAGQQPLVVVGPARPLSATPTAGYALLEVHKRVEVRVRCRKADVTTDGYSLDGVATLAKILDSIRSIIQNNKGNPDGTGQYQAIWVDDPGRDIDIPQANPLYGTAMQVHVFWLE